MKLGEAIDHIATALETTDEIVAVIGEATDDMGPTEQAATRMLILQILLTHACKSVGSQVEKHPREVLEKLIEAVLADLPQRPVEDRPERVSKTKGPSPWGEVR